MVKKLLVVSLMLSLFILPSMVSAQTATDSGNATAKLKQQLLEIQAKKKAEVVQVRTNLKEAVQTKREEAKAVMQAKREEFKTKIQTIKDEKKKAVVERIDAKLTNTNVKHTDRFIQVLTNLQTALDKIGTDIDKASAQSALDAAKVAVESQGAKSYTITISTETALKMDVGTVVSQLRKDLSATHKLVIDAKQAVQKLRANPTTGSEDL